MYTEHLWPVVCGLLFYGPYNMVFISTHWAMGNQVCSQRLRRVCMHSLRLRTSHTATLRNEIRGRRLHARGVASGTASRALALLDFWLAGPTEPTFQRVFLAPLLDYWSDHFPVADSGGFLWFQFGSTRMRSDRRPSAVIFADVANWLTVAPFQPRE